MKAVARVLWVVSALRNNRSEIVLRWQHRVLSELQPNTESVGELWLGLLRFYTEEFDFKEHVISIRQKKRLTTFEKQWTSKCIAIEGAWAAVVWSKPRSSALFRSPLTPLLFPSDPFDLNHNLGAGVSRKSECPGEPGSMGGLVRVTPAAAAHPRVSHFF